MKKRNYINPQSMLVSLHTRDNMLDEYATLAQASNHKATNLTTDPPTYGGYDDSKEPE